MQRLNPSNLKATSADSRPTRQKTPATGAMLCKKVQSIDPAAAQKQVQAHSYPISPCELFSWPGTMTNRQRRQSCLISAPMDRYNDCPSSFHSSTDQSIRPQPR